MVKIADGMPCKHIKYENGIEIITYEVATKRYIPQLDIYKKGIKRFSTIEEAQIFYDNHKVKIDEAYIDKELNNKIYTQNLKLKVEKKRLKRLCDNLLCDIVRLSNAQKREVYKDMINGFDNKYIMEKFNVNFAQVARMRKYFNEKAKNAIQ